MYFRGSLLLLNVVDRNTHALDQIYTDKLKYFANIFILKKLTLK